MRKNIILSAIMVLITTMFVAVMPTEAEGAVYKDTVRLHILADSDSAEDQNLKIAIRDAVLAEFGSKLSKAESADDAREELTEMLEEIKEFCEAEVIELGYDIKVSVSLSEEWYETREYESFTLPAGTYSSLRIVLGEGEGQNWWCVMFPPMCLDVATEDAPADDAIKKYTDEEFVLISGNGYKAKFKILELISSAFS